MPGVMKSHEKERLLKEREQLLEMEAEVARVRAKLERSWTKLSRQAQDMMAEQYQAARRMLASLSSPDQEDRPY